MKLDGSNMFKLNKHYLRWVFVLFMLIFQHASNAAILNLKVYLQSYYKGSGLMTPVLMNQDIGSNSLVCDSVTVELHDAISFLLVASQKVVLSTNGQAIASFTGVSGFYYIAIRHRNSMFTWSSSPINVTSNINYDFTTSASKAFGACQSSLTGGMYALYGGDINQDNMVDLNGISQWLSNFHNFIIGYKHTDLDGDGNTNISDYPVLETNVNAGIHTPILTKTLIGPILERKVYALLNGYNSSDDFETSSVYAQGNYFYMVFDNRYLIVKILNTLPQNSGSNSLLGSGSGSSNFEGITYYNNGTPHWYVLEESVQNGSVWNPRIRQYDDVLNYMNNEWAEYNFNSIANNKAFEGIAYIRRNNNDYLLSIVEGTGKIAVMQQSSGSWTKLTELHIPVTFSDYSDIALYGDRIAILTQEDAKLWVGNLSATSWSILGNGFMYDFPTGNSSGVVGAGNLKIYGNIEGVSFINDSTIVTCSDKASNSQPSYQTFKDQSLQIFRLW